MAKKEEKEESYEFVPPDFDEDAFIHKEMVSFRTTVILFLWGIVAALVSFGLFAAMGGAAAAWYYGLLICLGFGLALKVLFPKLGADISHFGRREWMGTGFLFFFTWLAFFILFVNPPVGDFAEPRVGVMANPTVQQFGTPVDIEVFVADDQAIADVSFRLQRGLAGEVVATEAAWSMVAPGHYRYTTAPDLRNGTYHYEVEARDKKGHLTQVNGVFEVRSQALRFDGDGRTLASPTDLVSVQIPARADGVALGPCTRAEMRAGVACIHTVSLNVTGPAPSRVVLEYKEDVRAWVAGPSYLGWAPGTNEFSVEAKLAQRYDGTTAVPGARIVLAGPFTVEVTAATGDYQPKIAPEPAAPNRQTPGLGLIPIAIGLLAIAIWRRGDGNQ